MNLRFLTKFWAKSWCGEVCVFAEICPPRARPVRPSCAVGFRMGSSRTRISGLRYTHGKARLATISYAYATEASSASEVRTSRLHATRTPAQHLLITTLIYYTRASTMAGSSRTPEPSNQKEDSSYSKMSVGDVEAIGAHCQMPFCHQLDFLPFRCESCRG